MRDPNELHPYVEKAQKLLSQGRMSRREFMRTATLLGASYGTAQE